jgi:signal transduction histidine kinase
VLWRRLAGSAQSREQTLQLIGSKAALYVGNDRGDFWTDLVRVTPPPPVEMRHGRGVVEYARAEGGGVLAVLRPVPGTPWVVLTEFPRDVATAEARRFLRPLAAVALVLLVLGLASAWWLGRRIVVPLRELTGAVTAVAAGDYSRPVTVNRSDELGRLAGAFNTMAGEVYAAQHRLEELVRERTAQLEQRNAELEAFGYSISHDLRAPLRAMQGFGQALLEDCGTQLDATGRGYAERVVTGAKRMDELIRDLLAYSRLTTAAVPLSAVELSAVVRDAVAQLEGDLRSKGVQLSVTQPLPAVRGHAATLAQAVANLIANGIKFVAPGRVAALRIRAEPHGGSVRLWVEDNGIGIASEHYGRIFGVFERLHDSTEYPGTGIGLAIVKKSIERMGGRVGVESVVGEGSRFWIELAGLAGAA